MLRNAVRILFHLAPLIPLIWGDYYLAASFALLLAVCYIKAKELGLTIDPTLDQVEMPADSRKFLDSTVKARKIWSYPTLFR